MIHQRYLIAGPIRLDTRDERLWYQGQSVRLGGKAFGLLRALMETPGTLVTKDTLFERVWPGVTVSDSVLTTAVKELRQAIGDDARTPRVIETVYGRGYRFLPRVEESDDAGPLAPPPPLVAETHSTIPVPDPPAVSQRTGASQTTQGGGRVRRRPAALLAIFVLAVLALVIWRPWEMWQRGGSTAEAALYPKSIAVLPFDDLSSGGDQGWFAEGLTEEILNSLARIPDLHVASRTSAAGMKRKGAGVTEAARALGVAHILEGSVRRSGGRVRVTAQLIRASDGYHLWSQNFDRAERDVISIQEETAFAIASALKTVMDPAKLRAMTEAGTRSVDAYQEYLRGLAYDQRHLDLGEIESARKAAAAFERARMLDPNFAAAHWQSAQNWFGRATRVDSQAGVQDGTPAERLAGYMTRVDAAIANSRDPADTLKYRAARASMQLRFREALRLLTAYLELRPRDIDGWQEMTDVSAYAGDRAATAKAAERIHALSIENGNPLSRAITASVMALQFDKAAARAREQLKLRPDNALIQYQAHRAFLWAGRTDEARRILPRVLAGKLPEDNRLMAQMRQACAEGRRPDAEALGRRIDALSDPSVNPRWLSAMLIGDHARADALLRPLDTPEGLPTLMQFMIYPMFDARHFPQLSARLAADGVTPILPVAEPYACK
ncbi:winged helix-turn-helix domain-containing protein [Sphingomonas sp. LaA6.9]|uniref:winged helix-turn-helix domain-containing protein n=1 Tax=Sphingomonas sp. LaA6.9 TaxID=2919914 RepID=UPI001F501971|nr:winged helix-turn-helix domain-containing protein [Sphingomonas sp. LaA6.9]MCJ8156374.1 winged helix-turn-helix domain-containing protein [Sphingomonas sp. LaA6.9]